MARTWRIWVLLWLPAIALAGVQVHKHVDHDHWTDEYDDYFRKYAKHYFGPHMDWRWFKAQGIAESALNPKAVSPVGAKGIMQIMPATYQEILKKNPHFPSIKSPRWNIAAGIYYDRYLYRNWKKHQIPSSERLAFSFGSYNAGYGGVLRAYKKAKKKRKQVKLWEQVSPFAPKETQGYVKRIVGLMETD